MPIYSHLHHTGKLIRRVLQAECSRGCQTCHRYGTASMYHREGSGAPLGRSKACICGRGSPSMGVLPFAKLKTSPPTCSGWEAIACCAAETATAAWLACCAAACEASLCRHQQMSVQQVQNPLGQKFWSDAPCPLRCDRAGLLNAIADLYSFRLTSCRLADCF